MVDKAEQAGVLADAFQENAKGEQKIPTGKKLTDFIAKAPVDDVLDFFLQQAKKGPKERDRIGKILSQDYVAFDECFDSSRVLNVLIFDRAEDDGADHGRGTERKRFHKAIEIFKALDEKKLADCLYTLSFFSMLRLDAKATLDFIETLPQGVFAESLYDDYYTILDGMYDLKLEETDIARALMLIAKSIDHVAKSKRFLAPASVASPTDP